VDYVKKLVINLMKITLYFSYYTCYKFDDDWVVPRYVSEVKDSYFCPKFLSLPDVIKILPGVPKILNFEVNIKEFPISTAAVELGKQLGKSQSKALNAYKEAQKYFDEYHDFLREGASVNHALRLVE